MDLPIPGFTWIQSQEALLVSFPAPLLTLCSGVVGGGLTETRHILNMHVDKDYHGSNPAADLEACARRLGVSGQFAGLMTAAWVHRATPFSARDGELSVCVLATIGLGNATCAGVSLPAQWKSGTINLIALVDANLTPAAYVNLVISMTEAKSDFLRRLGWRTAEGEPATGTSTDAIAIAASGRGPMLPYAGPATPVGYLTAQMVRRALDAYRLEPAK